MKKSDVINLIKFHYTNRENDFKNQALSIAKDFDESGDHQLASYTMTLISQLDTLVPQESNPKSTNSNIDLGEYLTLVKYKDDSLPLPNDITRDLLGIRNAIMYDIGLNKYLLAGKPGTGKTQSVIQLSQMLNRKLLMVDMYSLIDSKLGQTSKNIKKLFEEIDQLAKTGNYLFLFDEIDSLVLDRINSSDLREMGRVTSTFLRMLDDLNPQVLLIATTNLLGQLDPALKRRFDTIIDFDRYTDDDLVIVATTILEDLLPSFNTLNINLNLFKKIISSANPIPYPGDLRNIIRTSLGFSDPKDPNDYLKRLFVALHSKSKLTPISLSELGFTIREISLLTGTSKSTISRKLNSEEDN